MFLEWNKKQTGTRRRSWQCISPPSDFSQTPPFRKNSSYYFCHYYYTFDGDPDLWNSVRHLANLFPWNLAAQKHEISAQFRTTLRLDRKYLQKATRYRLSKNVVANYGHSHTGKLNSVYFGPQTVKNRTGVLSHPLAIVQRTGVNKSVAFDRWRHWPTQRAAITLGIAMHLVVD